MIEIIVYGFPHFDLRLVGSPDLGVTGLVTPTMMPIIELIAKPRRPARETFS